jgi:hypothetical protein
LCLSLNAASVNWKAAVNGDIVTTRV